MTRNLGNSERIIRAVIGAALLSLLFVLDGNMRYLGLIGVVLLATAAMGWCALWTLLGINTCPVTQRKVG